MNRKSQIIILSSFILSACGGGGGGGSDPEFIKLEQQAVSLAEGSESAISFSSSFDDLSFQVIETTPEGVGTVTLQSGQLKISANETDRPGIISGVLYSQGKGVSHSTSKPVSIAVQNASAKDLEAQASDLVNQKQDILALNEDKAIYQFIVEASYLNGLIDYNEKDALLSSFSAQNAPTYSAISSEIDSFEAALSSYEKAEISDADLAVTLTNANASITDHSDYAAQKLSEISVYSDPYFGDLTITSMAYDPISGRYSRYLGQEAVGVYEGETWSFVADYQLLSSLVIRTLSGSIPVCEAN